MSQSDCLAEIGPFLDAMQQIDSRLAVGMNESDFVQRVGTAKVKHDSIDAAAISGRCLDAGTRLESALNAYIKAAGKWSACVSNYSCAFKKINTYMQAKWGTATLKISKAKAEISNLPS